jgi:cell division protein ZapA
MKQLEVQIMGQGYLLGCPEGGESRLLEAVERVDTAMCKIRDAGKIKARDRIAVLAALNLAFDLADRSLAELEARRAQPPSPSPFADAETGDAVPEDPRLAALLERLDHALGQDGQLL